MCEKTAKNHRSRPQICQPPNETAQRARIERKGADLDSLTDDTSSDEDDNQMNCDSQGSENGFENTFNQVADQCWTITRQTYGPSEGQIAHPAAQGEEILSDYVADKKSMEQLKTGDIAHQNMVSQKAPHQDNDAELSVVQDKNNLDTNEDVTAHQASQEAHQKKLPPARHDEVIPEIDAASVQTSPILEGNHQLISSNTTIICGGCIADVSLARGLARSVFLEDSPRGFFLF